MTATGAGGRGGTQPFRKRVFTARRFRDDVAFLVAHSLQMARVVRNPAISRAFVEKIMTVTTAVNECTYCAWYHARAAVASGIEPAEVKRLLELQFHATASDSELPALLYAQHYAETDRRPDPAMTARLVDAYGDRTATDITLVIRLITFANLLGNTWEAARSQRRGGSDPVSR